MKMRHIPIAVFMVFSGLYADAIDDLKPGEWYEVPNSRLDAVKPAGFTANVIEPWCGGALDTKRNRMLIWGGGHTDYQGNEIYAFDLSGLAWSRIWGPTPLAQIPSGGNFETYPDGNPGSRHTYDGLAYLPDPIDALWACSGALWQGGGGSDATWIFKFGAGQWERKANFAPGSSYWQVCGYDSARGLVISEGMYWTSEYNPRTDAWTGRYQNGGGWWNDSRKGEIDPVRREMVILGAGNCHIYNLDTYSSTDISHACTGDTAIIGADAPGLAYDPRSGKMVAWKGGTSVYTLDIASRRWTLVQPAVTNTANPGPATSTGTYGRWRYIPSRNVFFVVNGITKNVFLYRLNAGNTSAEGPGPGIKSGAAVCWSGLYDIRGKRVAAGERWEASRLPAGVYLQSGRAGAKRVFRKVLVAR